MCSICLWKPSNKTFKNPKVKRDQAPQKGFHIEALLMNELKLVPFYGKILVSRYFK